MYIYFGLMILISIIAILTRKNNKLFWIICGILVFLVMGLRSPTVGTDTNNYINIYLTRTQLYISYFFNEASIKNVILNDPLYFLYSYLLLELGVSSQAFIIITAAITVFIMFRTMYLYSEQPFLCIFSFLTVGLFPLMMSAFRQGLAIAIVSLSYNYIINRKPLKFALTVIIAAGFHVSAFVVLPLYPIFLLLEKRRPEQIITISVMAGFSLSGLLYGIILALNLGPRFSSYLEGTISLNPLVIIMYISIIAICLILDHLYLEQIDNSLNLFYIAYGIGLIVLIISMRNTMISRFSYFYLIPLPVLLSNSINRIVSERDRGLTVMACLFVELLYFIYDNLDSVLNIANYSFFWQ